MSRNWLLGLLLLEGAGCYAVYAALLKYRVDGGGRETFFRAMTENWRCVSPRSYNEEGRRRLPLLWLVALLMYATLLSWLAW